MTATPRAAAEPTNPGRVLLIEHEEADAELTRRALRESWPAIQVDVVSTPDEIEKLSLHSYDVLLSDYRLPGWNGLEAFRSLKARGLQAPFILLTGTLGEERAVDCFKEGIADYVLKDKLVKLPVAVTRALQESATRRERARALEELRWAHDQLENRVAERTAELSAANRALRKEAAAQARLVAILQATQDFVATANLKGKLLFLNSSGRELIGLGPDEETGGLHLPDLCRDWQAQPPVVADAEPPDSWNGESYLLRRDGSEVPVITMTVLHRDSNGRPEFISLVAHDITQRKEVERMKEELVATVSHELRTPLASLRGFSELMLKRSFSEEKRREFLGIIQKETIRLSDLINNFLDLQKMEWGRQTYDITTLDLGRVLQEAIAVFQVGHERHRFSVDARVGLRPILADAGALRQVLSNLLSNAVKYSPQGGEIKVSARAEAGEAVVSISDHGIGIPAEAMPFLFSKFFRVNNGAHREIGGTGLGLSLVKQIVLAHRGRVWAESLPGQGSTFHFTLALAPTVNASFDQRCDLLIIESDSSYAELLCTHFAHCGLKVRSTGSGQQAMEWILRNPPRMVLLDVHLTGAMDGWDLLVTLRGNQQLCGLPVLVISGHSSADRGLALGGAEYILKTAAREEFLAAVRRQLPDLKEKQILIADDEPTTRARLASFLDSTGAFTTQVGNGRLALERITMHPPDLLLLDLLMPEVDGFEVIRRLRRTRSAVNLPILVVTAKDLALNELVYLRQSLASLVGRSEADLNYFSKVVGSTLGVDLTLAANDKPRSAPLGQSCSV
ncbi:MAG: response regulator [Terriglobales bacterium]